MRVAVEDLDATFVGLGRALVAAVLAGALLAIRREPLPDRRDLPRFAVVGLGVVIGFPLLSALALQHLTSAHTSVVVGLLPAATAVWAVARAGERPPRRVLGRGRRRRRRRARVRRDAGRRRDRGRRPARARRGRARRARLRRGRRALAPLRRLAGDLLGAAAHGAVPRPPRRALDARRPARRRRGVARLRVTSPSSRCSSASSPGTTAWRSAASRRSARSSSRSRCSRSCGPRCCSPRRSRPRWSSPRSPCSPASWRPSAHARVSPR